MGYDKEAHRYAEDTYDYARNFAKPADSVYNNYYQKAFGGAYNTAQGLDQLGPLYSGYNMAEDNLRKQMARQGMGQSGAMQSAGRGLFNTFSQQAGQQSLQARMAKEQALSGLAGQAIGGANMGQNAIYNANTERANIAMQRAGMQNQNNMQQQQAIGNLIGGGISLAGTLGGAALGGPMGAMLGVQLAGHWASK